MLAPVTEAQFGESALTALLLEGSRRWPAFAAALEKAPRARRSATTRPARSPSRSMRPIGPASTTSSPTSTRSGCRAERRSASECRALVPALSPALRGGIEVPGDHHVDNRALLDALVRACVAAGVTFVEGTVSAVERGPRARPGGRPPPRGPTTSSWRRGPACPPSPASRMRGSRPSARSRATSCASARPAGRPAGGLPPCRC